MNFTQGETVNWIGNGIVVVRYVFKATCCDKVVYEITRHDGDSFLVFSYELEKL